VAGNVAQFTEFFFMNIRRKY